MKKVILAGLLTVGMAVSASANDTKVATSFSRSSGAQVDTYHNIGLGSSRLILGLTAGVPSTSEKDRGLLLLGKVGLTFDTDLPILQNFELTADFQKGQLGNISLAKNVSISRKYLTKLTDNIEVGIDVKMFNINFDEKQILIFSEVGPVLSLNAKL